MQIIDPQFIDMILLMQGVNSKNGEHQFAYRDRNTEEQLFKLSFTEDDFFIRKPHHLEVSEERYQAEKLITSHVRLTDTKGYLDTVSVSKELVSDPEAMFLLFSHASKGKSFQEPCHLSYDYEYKITVLEPPLWFDPVSFASIGIWILCALEKTLWMHYF